MDQRGKVRNGRRSSAGEGSPMSLPGLPRGAAGDPGLFGPDSLFWRVNRERALVLSAPAVLLLQLAHPLIAQAVADHMDFSRSPAQRLRSTLSTTLTVEFGDSAQAEAAAGKVRDIHERVHGYLGAAAGPFAAGAPYDATDQELLLWGHATVVQLGMDTFSLLVRALGRDERARYVQEARSFGMAFGLDEASLPPDLDAFDAYYRSMIEGPTLEVGAEARRLAEEVLHPSGGMVVRASTPMTVAVTAGLLPARVREDFGLRWGPVERATVRSVAAWTSATLRFLPARLRYWPHYRVGMDRASNR